MGFMDQMPTMKEWRRLHAEGRLSGPQSLFFQSKPSEELYDTVAYPHEIRNLAADPTHAGTLSRMRAALDDWIREYGDQGETPEPLMMERMRPAGRYGTRLRSESTPGDQVRESGVGLCCPTEGASIGYTTESGRNANWLLYSKDLEFAGPVRLRAKAICYGFKESAETTAEYG